MIRLINVIFTWNLIMEERLDYRKISVRDQLVHTLTVAIEAHPQKISITFIKSSKVSKQSLCLCTKISVHKINGFSSIDLLVEISTASVSTRWSDGFSIIKLSNRNNLKRWRRFIPIMNCSDLWTSSTIDHMFALQMLASHFLFLSLSFCFSLVHRRPHTDGWLFDERVDHVIVLNDTIWSGRSWLKAAVISFTSIGRLIDRPAADCRGWFWRRKRRRQLHILQLIYWIQSPCRRLAC